MEDLTEDQFKLLISPYDNGSQLRCSAIVMVEGKTACVIYSEPVTINCAKSYNGYEVDWEGNKIKVTKSEEAEVGSAYLGIYDSDGSFVKAVMIEDEADLSEYINKGYDIRLYVLKDNLTPVIKPFER